MGGEERKEDTVQFLQSETEHRCPSLSEGGLECGKKIP